MTVVVRGAKVMAMYLLRSKVTVCVLTLSDRSISGRRRVANSLLRALRHGPLAGIDFPAGHVRGDGNAIEIVGDDFDVIGRGLGDEDGDALVSSPAHRIAN